MPTAKCMPTVFYRGRRHTGWYADGRKETVGIHLAVGKHGVCRRFFRDVVGIRQAVGKDGTCRRFFWGGRRQRYGRRQTRL